jgi:hypothetical protein
MTACHQTALTWSGVWWQMQTEEVKGFCARLQHLLSGIMTHYGEGRGVTHQPGLGKDGGGFLSGGVVGVVAGMFVFGVMYLFGVLYDPIATTKVKDRTAVLALRPR